MDGSETNLKEKHCTVLEKRQNCSTEAIWTLFFVRLLVPNTPDTAVSSSWASDPVGVSRRVPCRSTWPGSPPSPYAWPWWVGTCRCRSSPGSRPNPLKGQVDSITQNVRKSTVSSLLVWDYWYVIEFVCKFCHPLPFKIFLKADANASFVFLSYKFLISKQIW